MLACLSGSFSGLPILEVQLLRANGPNGLTVVAAAYVQAVNAGIEVEALRVERITRVERRGPVAAVRPIVKQVRTVTIPGSAQENETVGIPGLFTYLLVTLYAVHGDPDASAVVY